MVVLGKPYIIQWCVMLITIAYIIICRFHIISPMYVGFANTVNSLYNIKNMVYDQNNIVSLEALRMALFNNWGEK